MVIDTSPGTLSSAYLGRVATKIGEIEAVVSAQIVPAAEAIAASLGGSGLLHAWGSGHSFVLAKELFYRAGGLAQVNAVYDLALTGVGDVGSLDIGAYDGQVGHARAVLDAHDIRAGEVLVVFTPYGTNVAAVDACLWAEERGVTTVVVASDPPAGGTAHPAGRTAQEIADFWIRNPIDPDDAVVPVGPYAVGATATATGAVICQLLVVETVAAILRAGGEPEVIVAARSPEARAANAATLAPYAGRIHHL
ncbi:sugar isomerase domain-containing protein [Nocardioides carbamazepini]|uniref:sugar isomerase domain-containing protein n=1 Tax=Nocardioides carbamazepini TaxID=2854259 RepID=UPI00214A7255|nr:sugar isomerase domain-containing protein [Nocardioides carbamazepini]MCR1782359.1 sugar isomerase domain-containing protein [Nocardioides carbamazepini]